MRSWHIPPWSPSAVWLQSLSFLQTLVFLLTATYVYLTWTAGFVLVQYRASGFWSQRTQHHYGGHERKGRRPKRGARLAWGISRRGVIQVPGPAPHAAFLGSCDRI